MDSTGLAHRSKGQRLRWRRGCEQRQVRGHSRLLCLVRYYRGRRLLVLEEVAVGPAYASDVRLGLRTLGQAGAGGKLLADRALGSRAIWALLEGKGMEAHIPLKGGGEVRDRRRLAAKKRFDPSLYRLRGVVEGVFGALKTRLAGGYLQEILPQMAQGPTWRQRPTTCKPSFASYCACSCHAHLPTFSPQMGHLQDKPSPR
ncbi:MAG: transposase [Dehalococcoidia bacterium]|nr:transposase [Dehalococcoidia bacterium]